MMEEESRIRTEHDEADHPYYDEDDDDEDVDMGDAEERSYERHDAGSARGCRVRYETVSVVKQVPTFSKHCHKVQDTKCKTIFKNSFQTKMETQCVASFDTRKADTRT